MDDAAGPVQQHRGVRHPGDDGADGGGLDRIDAADVFARCGGVVQPPRHQRGGSDAEKNDNGPDRRQFAENDHHEERKGGREQDDRRMPQPIRPGGEEGRRRIVNSHQASSHRFRFVASGADIPALPNVHGFVFRLGGRSGSRRLLRQAFEPRTDYNLSKRQ